MQTLLLPPHLGMSDVLVEHDSTEDLRLFNTTPGYLLHSGIPLDVYLPPPTFF